GKVGGRELASKQVVTPPHFPHDEAFLADLADAVDDLIALLPAAHELRNQLGRILEVGGEEDHHGVAARAHEPVEGRTEWPDIARVDDDLDPAVPGGESLEDLHRPVGRSVVAEDVFVVVVRQLLLEDTLQGQITVADVVLLVEAGRDDADYLPGTTHLCLVPVVMEGFQFLFWWGSV